MRLVWVAAVACAIAVPSAGLAQRAPDLRKPAGKEWLTIGGDWGNSRYSTLAQINRNNVKNLKGAWVVHLGSGLGAKYSMEGTPIVRDGVMYVTTGNDDVYALDARTGALIWENKSGIDQNISTVCCGWSNRGAAVAEGKVFLGYLDGNVVALDTKTGKQAWKTQIGALAGRLHHHVGAALPQWSALSGISGGDRSSRGFVLRSTPRPAKRSGGSGPCRRRASSAPTPGPSRTIPTRSAQCLEGWRRLGLADAGDRSRSRPDLFLDRQSRPGCRRHGPRPAGRQPLLRLDRGGEVGGKYAWHFQQVHHDLWDFDCPAPGRPVRPDL